MPMTTTLGIEDGGGPRRRNETASTSRSAAASGDGGRVVSIATPIAKPRTSAIQAEVRIRVATAAGIDDDRCPALLRSSCSIMARRQVWQSHGRATFDDGRAATTN